MRITQSLHRSLQQAPDRPLTVYKDRTRTVAQSADRVARLAGALQDLGVATGDRVGILSLNSDRYHEFLYAAPWAGAVAVPVNIRWTPPEIIYSLEESDTRVLLVDDAFAPMIPALKQLWSGLTTIVHCGDGPLPDGTVGYEEILAAAEPVADAERGDDDLYALFYTGGTTGFPKGVMLSHDNLLTMVYGSIVTHDLVVRGGRILHAAPMFHLADVTAWLAGNLSDSTHVIIPMFEPKAVLATIAQAEITDALLVPTMIQMTVDHPEAGEHDLSSVRHVLYGASPISEAVLERARKTLPGAEFTQAYGMTELAAIATLLLPTDHDDPALRRAAGRAAAHMDIKIVDPGGNELPCGEVGEIIARGDNVMQGYWNKPEETAAVLRDGWMHTGDGGYMDERGYVFIVDRIKDMIVTGGENVYSAEVENALAQHPAVAACAVIGVPDDNYGERVHAVVVRMPGATTTPQEITDACREHIANYKVPRSVAFVDALPISGAGKVLKRELRKQHWGASDRNVN